MTTLFPMKYSLFDLLVAITIAAIFAAVTPAWLRHVIEASSIQDAEFADPGFELRREKRIAVYAPLLSLLYAASACGCWLSLRTAQKDPSWLIAFGFALPILSAPLLPMIPAFWIPGIPVIILMFGISVAALCMKRFVQGGVLLFTTFYFFAVGSFYGYGWNRLILG